MASKTRLQRKEEHLQLALTLKKGPKPTGFDDVEFIHQAVSDASLTEIDVATEFLGRKLAVPLLIEAITGGTARGMEINKAFAQGAAKTGIAMAVGSQTAAIEDKSLRQTFTVVREYNPEGIILANVAAGATVDYVLEAVEMIKADGIQLHLNTVQELLMTEGDRNFVKTKENIKQVIKCSPVPVIVKEVGYGLSREAAYCLFGLGVDIIDVGGTGGTNFAAIENNRREEPVNVEWYNWGIPTVASLLECLDTKLPLRIIASGGIDSGLKAAKALALGALLAGAAHSFLRCFAGDNDVNKIVRLINTWTLELKMAMLLTGAKNLGQLRQKPLIIKGLIKEWAEIRGIQLSFGLK